MKRGKLKNVATAQYDFSALREKDDYVYVDKMDMLARLASKEKDAIYFISRPRRFGKSLMLSTLRCMFEGRKELFRDVYTAEYLEDHPEIRGAELLLK